MVTPFHPAMVTSWFPPTTMHPTTTKEVSRDTPVDLLPKSGFTSQTIWILEL